MAVPVRTVSATQFKAQCLRLIEDLRGDPSPVTITRRGRPVAVLRRFEEDVGQPFLGKLQRSVFRYDDPLAPAASPNDWGPET
jgi:antitoxin (DNA-binding transcriptional repressor) of toxin-antitoxin stability system